MNTVRTAVLDTVLVTLGFQFISDLHKSLPRLGIKLPTAIVDYLEDGVWAGRWLRQPLSSMQQLQQLVDLSQLRSLAITEDLPECHAVAPEIALLVELPVQQCLRSTPATMYQGCK